MTQNNGGGDILALMGLGEPVEPDTIVTAPANHPASDTNNDDTASINTLAPE